jgi:hypothetical protein
MAFRFSDFTSWLSWSRAGQPHFSFFRKEIICFGFCSVALEQLPSLLPAFSRLILVFLLVVAFEVC